jgi:hypothetical protein
LSQLYKIPCPWCNEGVEASEEWLTNNSRVCCRNCNKSFEVMVKSKEEADEDSQGNGDYWD